MASTEVVNYREQLRRELAEVNNRVAPPSGRTISTKGKMFTLPDGSQAAGPLSVIILDWRAVNMYYTGAYNPNDPQTPKCWSIGSVIDDMVPSSNAPERKHEDCKSCPMNQWGSAPGGSKGKACKNTRRLALVAHDAKEGTEPLIINVSPTGIQAFEGYVRKLRSEHKALPIQMVTEIGFREDATYPTLTFASGEPVSDDRLGTLMKLREAAQDLLDKEPEA
jgi:hypothetical protein